MASQVLVGLSGGVDSFVTALLLQQRGYEVVGAHLSLWDDETPEQQEELERLCRHLHVPLYRVDGKEAFRQRVVEPFVHDYLHGRTPSPCCTCNGNIKWHLLRQQADRLRIPHLATGHYVRTGESEGHHYFFKGRDPQKDQSYFLWEVPEEIIAHAITPLGDYTKTEVKAIARENGFPGLAEKRESMGICFLQGEDYRAFILRHHTATPLHSPGVIKNRQGEIIGEHGGILHYTIGQKREIPLQHGEPYHVIGIDASQNCLIAGPKEALFTRKLTIHRLHLIQPGEIYAPDVELKIRGIGLNPAGYITASPLSEGRLSMALASPAWAPAPGQPVALYRGERLIGGGILE